MRHEPQSLMTSAHNSYLLCADICPSLRFMTPRNNHEMGVLTLGHDARTLCHDFCTLHQMLALYTMMFTLYIRCLHSTLDMDRTLIMVMIYITPPIYHDDWVIVHPNFNIRGV